MIIKSLCLIAVHALITCAIVADPGLTFSAPIARCLSYGPSQHGCFYLYHGTRDQNNESRVTGLVWQSSCNREVLWINSPSDLDLVLKKESDQSAHFTHGATQRNFITDVFDIYVEAHGGIFMQGERRNKFLSALQIHAAPRFARLKAFFPDATFTTDKRRWTLTFSALGEDSSVERYVASGLIEPLGLDGLSVEVLAPAGSIPKVPVIY